MELKTLDEVGRVADILPSWLGSRPLSKSERLDRWADALERQGDRRLRTLFEIEHAPPAKRAALRANGSPLTVAFDDPRLRAEGLAGDSVGDAVAFFGVSQMELHNILCFCHYGETMSAVTASVRVRCAATRAAEHQRLRAARMSAAAVVAMSMALAAMALTV